MAQAFGFIRGSDGNIITGSGNFTASRTSSGVYSITLQGTFSQWPVVVASPGGPYTTAQIILPEQSGANFTLKTGYTDKPNEYLDCDFTFHALWS